jgi:NADH-quinone oxidoreductase subunit C
VTDSPSEAEVNETPEGEGQEGVEEATSGDGLAAFAEEFAAVVGATEWTAEHGVARLQIDRDNWVAAAAATRDGGLPFFSWLSAVDWSREVEVGEPVASPDDLEERFEVICRLSSVRNADAVHLVATVPKDDPQLPSLVPEFGGAEWHEREAAEMFGIHFEGNPSMGRNLYLPESFEGNPLLKSFPLLSREVKPWPGTVDVEDMPTLENTEAAAQEAAQAEGDAE